MAEDATPVAPSATDPSSSEVLSSLSDQQYADWLMKGDTPEIPADKKAEAAPAKPVEQAGERPEKAPAPEPGKPAGHKGNADTRVQELLADRARERERADRAERELDSLRRGQAPPAKPAAPPAAKPVQQVPDELRSYDAYLAAHADASYEDFIDARAEFKASRLIEARERESQQRAAETARTEQFRTRNESFRGRLAEADKADPEWRKGIDPAVTQRLKPFDALQPGEAPSGYNGIAEELLASEHPERLLRHFSEHQDELHRIAALQPRQLLREMGALERELATKAATPPKTITEAPEPPPTLGKRAAEPADELAGAVGDGNFTAYFEAANRRALRK